MYNAFLVRTKEAITALGKHIRTSDRIRAAVFDEQLKCVSGTPCFDPSLGSAEAVPDRTEWRIIDHCAAVTRIYAIYEQFAHEMIREHLSLLQGRLSFSDLPEPIRSSYRSGIAKILDKIEGPRFADLDLGQLIGGYDLALKGKPYTIEPRAMLMQEQNLRLPELHRFMNACGIDGVTTWIEHHTAIQQFFSAGERLAASAERELAELIKYRNDASHGSIDITDILHVNVLIEFCDFISAVCEALSEKIQLAGLRTLKQKSHVRERGKVNELLKNDLVAIGNMIGAFRVGSTVYLCGDNYCLERTIVSIQLDDVALTEINLESATDIGMMLDAPGKKNAAIMMVEPLQARTEGDDDSANQVSSEVA